ncbi:MAG: hypothetical protein RBT20_00235 [Syntrophales bacterium]|jgi:ABC-type microcin C transport system duplicated ATPase subunit YejF|nr:hypothetical protein [Syntrophales bacterium]
MKSREERRERTAALRKEMTEADLDYRTLFERNYGIFTAGQQERIRLARVLILGDTGSGETIC